MSVRRHSQDILGDAITPEITERDLAGDAQWKMIQKNTFTRWTNEHLKTVNKTISDLETDLSDGLRFIALVEVLSGKRFLRYNKRPTIRSQKLENVTLALEFLQNEEKIKIVNIDSSAIVDCKLKLILGLIWTLILHYSISMPVWDEEELKGKKTEQTPKQRLLGWVLGKVPDVPVNNFTTDWNDGKAIGALVDGVAPGLCPDWDGWNPKDNITNATEAMNAAEQWLDVPQLIKPAEMCNPNVDEMSMMTYLSQFPNAKLKNGAPLRPKTNPSRVRAFGPGLETTGNSVGAPARFTVETFSAGRGDLEVFVINPKGEKEKCEIVFNNDRNLTYSCNYIPTSEGEYKIQIKFANREIPKSPFVTKVAGMAGDPSKVTASGPGLEKNGVMVKNKTYFNVSAKNAGIGLVDVIIVDPHGHKDTTKPHITKKSEEDWLVEYLPVEDGLHTVNILFAGKPIPHSPFSVGVAPAIDVKKCLVTGRGVQANGIRVGDLAEFKVQTKGAGNGELKVKLINPDGKEEKVKIKKGENDTYECSYEPKSPGDHVIHISYGNINLFKSPFPVEVGPQRFSKIKVYGPGLHSGVSNHPASFVVETNGETGGLGFSIEGPSQAKIDCSDNGDGSANITYLPTEPGEYAIHILCDNEDINQSPWMADIKPSPEPPFNPSEVKLTSDLPKKITVNEPVEFTLDTKKAGKGDLWVEAVDGDQLPLKVNLQDNKDGSYLCKFIPKKACKHVVMATFGNAIIKKFPHLLKVIEPSDPSKVKVSGPVFSEVIKVNKPSYFIVDPSEAGEGNLEIMVTDENGNIIESEITKEPNGTYKVSIIPTNPGKYQTKIFFDKKIVPSGSSSFNVKPDVDPSKVRVSGDGVSSSSIKASFPVSFVVDASQAGDSKLDIYIKDPEGHTLNPQIEESLTKNNIYQVTYTPENVGNYEIPVTYGNQFVPGSPFKVKSIPSGDADKVEFLEKIPSKIETGNPSIIKLNTSKAGEGFITSRVNYDTKDTKNSPSNVDIDILDNGDGTVDIVYVPKQPGNYKTDIKFGGKRIPNGSFVQEALDPKDYKNALANKNIEDIITPLKTRSTGRALGEESFKPCEFCLPVGPVFSFVTAEILTPSGKKEKPKVIDNGNGTVGISYKPKEEGLHKLFVLYNDKPVTGSPFDFYVNCENSGHVTASGPGLSHGVSGEKCYFYVNTNGSPTEGLSVSIEGPCKAEMDCVDNGNGICKFSYLPTVPGDYHINVLHQNSHVPGSPFKAFISPSEKDARKSFANFGALPLDLSENDLSKLKAFITYPSGKKEPCLIKRLEDGQLGISFSPEEIGDHYVEVLKENKPVPNSPFKITVNEDELGNANKVKVFGKGLESGKVNEINEFFINNKDAGYGNLSLSIEGPSKAEMVCGEKGEGVCAVKYKPMEPGSYVINIKLGDIHVPGSPFLVKVTDGGKGVKSEEIVKRGKGEEAGVGSDCSVALTMPATNKKDIEAKVSSPTGKVYVCEVENVGEDQYLVKFVPQEEGVHSVSIKHLGIHIPGSPFQFTVGPMTEEGAHRVKAIGPGLERGVVNKPANFNIYTREAGEGCLSIAVEGKSKANIEFEDAADGSCLVSYICEIPGDYLIHIKYNDVPIPDSPFRAYISPGEGGQFLNISQLQKHGCQLNQPALFTVDMKGSDGKLDAFVIAPSGTETEAVVEEVKDDVCSIRFVPHENGPHKIIVRKNGIPIYGSPFVVVVGSVEADPSLVRVKGEGLRSGKTGEISKFIVDTSKAGSGALAVTVDGPSKSQLSCKEVEDGYEFSYLPLSPGQYLISIKYGGVSHVPGSPFLATVSGSGLPGTWNEQSKVIVESVTKATTTHSYSSPLQFHDSDVSKVTSRGLGLSKASANKEAAFTVDTSKAGQNMLLVGVMGPEVPCQEVSVKYNQQGHYNVVYLPGNKGKYILVVKWGEDHVPGSPFHVVVD